MRVAFWNKRTPPNENIKAVISRKKLLVQQFQINGRGFAFVRGQFVFHALSIGQAVQTSTLQRGHMNKNILVLTIRADKAISFGGVKPFYSCPLHISEAAAELTQSALRF